MKHLAVVAGGFTGEKIISLKSAQLILDNISRARWSPTLVVIDADGWRVVLDDGEVPIDLNDFSYQAKGKRHTFDAAFIIVHGTPGEDGKLQSYFDLIGLKYTTGSATSTALTFHKSYCNDYLKAKGFRTAANALVRANDHYSTSEIVRVLGLPVFVKPNGGGSSLATTKVDAKEGLHRAIDIALTVDNEVIIEGFLPGREVTVGVVEINGRATALPVTEILCDGGFFDYQAKYEGKSQEITPAAISDELTAEVQRITEDLWHLLDLKGMARMDFMLTPEGPSLIEINTVPGFSSVSIIPQQAEAAGYSIGELIEFVLVSVEG